MSVKQIREFEGPEIPESMYPPGWFDEAARINLNEIDVWSDVKDWHGYKKAVRIFHGQDFRHGGTPSGGGFEKHRIKNLRGAFVLRVYRDDGWEPIPF